MLAHSTAIVTEADLEDELSLVRRAAAGGPAGIFGPCSVMWRVDREAATFLGAGRALLLQLAHPWVAAAITQHSRSLTDPIGRFHRTFSIVFTMVFGTTNQAFAAARRLHQRHATINGVLFEGSGGFPAGTSYCANDVDALRWVHATLVDTAVIAYELLNPPLSPEDRERYYTENRIFAALFGIPQSALPLGWEDFAAYVEDMFVSDALAVTDAARHIAAELFAGAGSLWAMPHWYHALSAGLLPPRLRDGFGLRYGPVEHQSAEQALRLLRYLHPRLPARLRYVAPYHEALARLAGHHRPGVLTRVLNCFWIGHGSMALGGE